MQKQEIKRCAWKVTFSISYKVNKEGMKKVKGRRRKGRMKTNKKERNIATVICTLKILKNKNRNTKDPD